MTLIVGEVAGVPYKIEEQVVEDLKALNIDAVKEIEAAIVAAVVTGEIQKPPEE